MNARLHLFHKARRGGCRYQLSSGFFRNVCCRIHGVGIGSILCAGGEVGGGDIAGTGDTGERKNENDMVKMICRKTVWGLATTSYAAPPLQSC